MTSNSPEELITNKALYEVQMELAKIGFELERGDITGATPSSIQARSNSSTPITVSYRTPQIKQRVVRAAQAANIWNSQMPKENAKREGKRGFFKEVAARRPSTKHTKSKKQETATPPIDGGQQFMLSDQPITDLRVIVKTIQQNREEEEELLRSQETAPIRPTHEMEINGQDPLARGLATPVPSGEELSPS